MPPRYRDPRRRGLELEGEGLANWSRNAWFDRRRVSATFRSGTPDARRRVEPVDGFVEAVSAGGLCARPCVERQVRWDR